MDIVKVCPELHIVMDVDSGLIAEMRKDILVVDLHPVEDEINRLAQYAKALENSLDPRNSPMKAYAGREGTYKLAGMFQGMFFGFWVTMAILVLVTILAVKMNLSLIGL